MAQHSSPEILLLPNSEIPSHLIWIDHDLEPDAIISSWAAALEPTTKIQCNWVNGELVVVTPSNESPVQLRDDRGDVYATVHALSSALRDSHEVYLWSESKLSTSHGFLLVSVSDMPRLSRKQRSVLESHFELIDPGIDYFSSSLLDWGETPSGEELEQIHERFAHLPPETRVGNPHPLEMHYSSKTEKQRSSTVKYVALTLIALLGYLVIKTLR